MNQRISLTVCSALLFASNATTSFAVLAKSEFATREDAIAMVKKGLVQLKSSGPEKTFADITGKKPQFADRDLYLTVYSLDGTCLAHGANERQVGRNLMELKDLDGRPFIRERLETAKTKPTGFWQDYKFTNPLTRKVEPKQMYCERSDEIVVCGGVYK